MSNDRTTPARRLTKAERGEIWAALQELGAVIEPILDKGNAPVWLCNLAEAMDAANRRVDA